MRETILRCDICKEVTDRLYAVDIENPISLEDKAFKAMFESVPFGRLTSDGMWEMEICRKCLRMHVYDAIMNNR